MQEILLSQKKMLDRLGQNSDRNNDASLAKKFEAHLQKVYKWMTSQKNVEFLYVNYNRILEDPLPYIKDIQKFLQRPIDTASMVSIIDKCLYRSKG